MIITARNADRVHRAGLELGPASRPSTPPTSTGSRDFSTSCLRLSTTYWSRVLAPHSAPLAEFDVEAARSSVDAHLILPLQVARNAATKVRPGGTLLFTGCTDDPSPAVGLSLVSGLSAALQALTKNLALAVAPVRVNLIAAGFVDTPLSAAILGDQLNARREQLRTTLPIRRVVDRADVAALAVHLMTNAAITGATFEIDGGQQLVHA